MHEHTDPDHMPIDHEGEASTILLRKAGLRPTRQRRLLADILFNGPKQHFTIDRLYNLIGEQSTSHLSLATVYNTMNQLADAGLVRKITLNGERTYFDTEVGDHSHFYLADEDRIIDIPDNAMKFAQLPSPPDGYEITAVDVVVHLKKAKKKSNCAGTSDRCNTCAMRFLCGGGRKN